MQRSSFLNNTWEQYVLLPIGFDDSVTLICPREALLWRFVAWEWVPVIFSGFDDEIDIAVRCWAIFSVCLPCKGNEWYCNSDYHCSINLYWTNRPIFQIQGIFHHELYSNNITSITTPWITVSWSEYWNLAISFL